MLLGSSDMMPRNLDRRVEVLFPVRDARIRRAAARYILEVHLRDNVKSHRLLPDGELRRRWTPRDGGRESAELAGLAVRAPGGMACRAMRSFACSSSGQALF